MGKWTAGNGSSGADLDANSGIFEDYDEYSGGRRPCSADSVLKIFLTTLSIFLFLSIK